MSLSKAAVTFTTVGVALFANPSKAETSYVEYQNGDYIGVLSSDNIDWYTALEYCQINIGTTLASVRDSNDNSDACLSALEAGVINKAWFGLHEVSNAHAATPSTTFVYTDSTLYDDELFSAWKPNHPSYRYGYLNCVYFDLNSNIWIDTDCHNSFINGFVCNAPKARYSCGKRTSSDCDDQYNSLPIDRFCNRCETQQGTSPLRDRCSKCCSECNIYEPSHGSTDVIDSGEIDEPSEGIKPMKCGNYYSSDCIAEFTDLSKNVFCNRCFYEDGESPLRTRCKRCCDVCNPHPKSDETIEPMETMEPSAPVQLRSKPNNGPGYISGEEESISCGNYISSDCESEYSGLGINGFCERCVTETGETPLRSRCSMCCTECGSDERRPKGNKPAGKGDQNKPKTPKSDNPPTETEADWSDLCGNDNSQDCYDEFSNLGIVKACDRCRNEGGNDPLRNRCKLCCDKCFFQDF